MANEPVDIPWHLWVRSRCPGCGLTGEGRYRLIMHGHDCPHCGARMVSTGQPFPIAGSDAMAPPMIGMAPPMTSKQVYSSDTMPDWVIDAVERTRWGDGPVGGPPSTDADLILELLRDEQRKLCQALAAVSQGTTDFGQQGRRLRLARVDAEIARRTPMTVTPRRRHVWGPSRVGHGEAQCQFCLITNREAAVIGRIFCSIPGDADANT